MAQNGRGQDGPSWRQKASPVGTTAEGDGSTESDGREETAPEEAAARKTDASIGAGRRREPTGEKGAEQKLSAQHGPRGGGQGRGRRTIWGGEYHGPHCQLVPQRCERGSECDAPAVCFSECFINSLTWAINPPFMGAALSANLKGSSLNKWRAGRRLPPQT